MQHGLIVWLRSTRRSEVQGGVFIDTQKWAELIWTHLNFPPQNFVPHLLFKEGGNKIQVHSIPMTPPSTTAPVQNRPNISKTQVCSNAIKSTYDLYLLRNKAGKWTVSDRRNGRMQSQKRAFKPSFPAPVQIKPALSQSRVRLSPVSWIRIRLMNLFSGGRQLAKKVSQDLKIGLEPFSFIIRL